MQNKTLSLITAAISLIIAFLLLMSYQFVSGKQQLMNELKLEANIIEYNLVTPMLNDDKATAREIIRSLAATPRIMCGALYDTQGQLFISECLNYIIIFKQSLDNYENKTEHTDSELIDIFVDDIVQKTTSTKVGTLVLYVSYKELLMSMFKYAMGIIVIGAIALLLHRQITARLRFKVASTENQLEQLAYYDKTTSLPNRKFFEKELDKAIKHSNRSTKIDAILFIDVDNFKRINDLSGHHVGDMMLALIAERIKDSIRTTDILARVGANSFAVLLYGIHAPENAARIATAIINTMHSPFSTEPVTENITVSIGLTLLSSTTENKDKLLKWAEMAMYVAKEKGKDCYQFYSDDIQATVRNELEIETELRHALADPNSGLWIAYQPQVCSRTNKLVGAEALIRWTRSDGSNLPPISFISIAEKTGLIVELGAWVIDRICQDLKYLRTQNINIPKIAINVSPRELSKGNAIVENICVILNKYGESISRFQYELTENALMDVNGAEVLDTFRKTGFSLAIDDFGSGYSSLGYLKKFQVSTLKIDKQFVDFLPGNLEDATIVKAVIQMSKALGITVVAEGVETLEQVKFLKEVGCDILQGYFISKPINRDALVTFVNNN